MGLQEFVGVSEFLGKLAEGKTLSFLCLAEDVCGLVAHPLVRTNA